MKLSNDKEIEVTKMGNYPHFLKVWQYKCAPPRNVNNEHKCSIQVHTRDFQLHDVTSSNVLVRHSSANRKGGTWVGVIASCNSCNMTL